MNRILSCAALALVLCAAPLINAAALAAPAPAPAPAPAANIDDFGCMVRTMYMAGAAESAAGKATDQAGRDTASRVASQNYEAASYFIGRLSAGKPVAGMKARFGAEVTALSKLDNTVLADQISQCVSRAQTQRAAFVAPMSNK